MFCAAQLVAGVVAVVVVLTVSEGLDDCAETDTGMLDARKVMVRKIRIIV